jgi:hypothetical protein
MYSSRQVTLLTIVTTLVLDLFLHLPLAICKHIQTPKAVPFKNQEAHLMFHAQNQMSSIGHSSW